MGEVHSLTGGPIARGEVSEHAVKALDDALERAKSGDVIGVAVVCLHNDGAASYDIAGRVGGVLDAGRTHKRLLAAIRHQRDRGLTPHAR